MDREDLRQAQAPLKVQYRADSSAALITLRAEGALDEGVTCSVATGRGLVEAGLHPATGGDGGSVCSGDMLLQALAACAGVTLRAVAVNRGLNVTGRIEALGELDVRGTLGIDPEAPVGFASIALVFHLESDASEDDLDALVATTERYCVVLQSIVGSPRISVSRTTA